MKYKDSSDTNGGAGLSPSDGKMLKQATLCHRLQRLEKFIFNDNHRWKLFANGKIKFQKLNSHNNCINLRCRF